VPFGKVRFSLDSDRIADMTARPSRANRRHGATDDAIVDPGTHVPVERPFTSSIDDMGAGRWAVSCQLPTSRPIPPTERGTAPTEQPRTFRS